jgi:hypothetical protein
MNHFNLLLLILLAFLTNISVKAADNTEVLQLQLTNGQTVTFQLKEKPEITFQEEKMLIVTTNDSAEYPFSEVAGFNFVNQVTAINELTDKELQIHTNGNGEWTIDSKQSTAVRVYNMSGKLTKASISRVGNSTFISLSNLPSGVYMISIGNHTIKTVKK